MRLFGSQLYAFVWGVAAGWLVTYLSLTHERRTVKSVRKEVVDLATYHDLTPAQSLRLNYEDWATDKEIWRTFCRVRSDLVHGIRAMGAPERPGFLRREIRHLARVWTTGLPYTENPTFVAAEIVLCTKVLGLAEMHARRTVSSIKTLGDIKQALAAVTAMIEEEDRRQREEEEKEAAEEAARVERRAKDWAEIEEKDRQWKEREERGRPRKRAGSSGMRRTGRHGRPRWRPSGYGDPDWFEKLPDHGSELPREGLRPR